MVNAQVTAMISFIEFIFFPVYVAVKSVAGHSKTVDILQVMYMILYLIVSPYAFLMNTSHNKIRIIEHGWINVMKNMTINTSIFKSAILLGGCKEETHELPDNEISSIAGIGAREMSTISRNSSSADRRRPPITPPRNQNESNGTNGNENQQDYQHYSEASSVLGNTNEKDANNDNRYQSNKTNTNSKTKILINQQNKISSTVESLMSTNLTKTDNISIETLYL